jgi:hypothetical protein
MGKAMFKALFTAIALFSLQPANAEDVLPPYGNGMIPCHLWLDVSDMYQQTAREIYSANQQTVENIYFAFAQGYLSGWNKALHALRKPTMDLTLMTEPAQIGYLEAFCRSHPDLPLVEAADKLRLEFEIRTAKRDRR